MNEELPQVEQVLLSTAISLVNLAGIRLTEQKDVVQAKEAIDAARALLPLCPEDRIGPIRDALAQLQMVYVRETGAPAEGAPAEGAPAEGAPAEQPAPESDERAKARSKIWTPPGT